MTQADQIRTWLRCLYRERPARSAHALAARASAVSDHRLTKNFRQLRWEARVALAILAIRQETEHAEND